MKRYPHSVLCVLCTLCATLSGCNTVQLGQDRTVRLSPFTSIQNLSYTVVNTNGTAQGLTLAGVNADMVGRVTVLGNVLGGVAGAALGSGAGPAGAVGGAAGGAALMQILQQWMQKQPAAITNTAVPAVVPAQPAATNAADTCDLSKPLIKETAVDGHRNDHEGNRWYRVLNRDDRGSWQAIDPPACIAESDGGNTITCACDPAHGWHLYRVDVDGDSPDGSPSNVTSPATVHKGGGTTRVRYERRQP